MQADLDGSLDQSEWEWARHLLEEDAERDEVERLGFELFEQWKLRRA